MSYRTRTGSGLGLLADRHFLIASAVLLVSFVGWKATTDYLDVVFQKLPVFWPEGVLVSDDYRNESLPTSFGPDGRYRRYGGFNPETKLPKGEIVLLEDTRLTLGMLDDPDRLEQRCSNWYVSRIYEDTSPDAVHKIWQLDVTYYTGLADPVPHVPNTCLVAGGGALGDAEVISVPAETDYAGWDGDIGLSRVPYESPTEYDSVSVHRLQYYLFSLNGRPETSRTLVRLELAHPLTKYAYYAKIQFGPLAEVSDAERTDKAAVDFLKAALPEILKQLPTPEDVRRLDEGEPL